MNAAVKLQPKVNGRNTSFSVALKKKNGVKKWDGILEINNEAENKLASSRMGIKAELTSRV